MATVTSTLKTAVMSLGRAPTRTCKGAGEKGGQGKQTRSGAWNIKRRARAPSPRTAQATTSTHIGGTPPAPPGWRSPCTALLWAPWRSLRVQSCPCTAAPQPPGTYPAPSANSHKGTKQGSAQHTLARICKGWRDACQRSTTIIAHVRKQSQAGGKEAPRATTWHVLVHALTLLAANTAGLRTRFMSWTKTNAMYADVMA